MSYHRFVVADALGAALWTVAFVTLGYVLGASWQVAEQWISRSGLVVGAILLLGAVWLWVRRRRRRAETPQTP